MLKLIGELSNILKFTTFSITSRILSALVGREDTSFGVKTINYRLFIIPQTNFNEVPLWSLKSLNLHKSAYCN